MTKIKIKAITMILPIFCLFSCANDYTNDLYEEINTKEFLSIVDTDYFEYQGFYFLSQGKYNVVAKTDYETNLIVKLCGYEMAHPNDGDFEKIEIGSDICSVVERVGLPEGSSTIDTSSLDFVSTTRNFYRLYLDNNGDDYMVAGKISLGRSPTTWFDDSKSELPSEDDVEKISIGMSFQEVVQILGKPQRDVGYGRIISEFDLSNGKILRTIFENDTEKRLEEEYSDIPSSLILKQYQVIEK